MVPENPLGPMLLWLDLETTGLDETKGEILEFGCSLSYLAQPDMPIAEPFSTVVCPADLNAAVKAMDPFVVDMHTRSGLLAELRLGNAGVPIEVLEEALLDMFPERKMRDQMPMLAGLNVGNFDLRWIKRHLPRFAKRLHYRVLDMRTVRLFCQSVGMPPQPEPDAPHRVMGDIDKAIELWSQCRDYVQGLR